MMNKIDVNIEIMEGFEQGEQVGVSQISEERAINDLEGETDIYFYIHSVNGMHIVIRENPVYGKIVQDYLKIVKIPEKEPKPYDFDTFPRGVVYLRLIDEMNQCLVVSMHPQGPIINENELVPYYVLKANYEISLDNCKTWQPAHQGVE